MRFLSEVFHEVAEELVNKERIRRARAMVLLASSIAALVGTSMVLLERRSLQNKDYRGQIESLNDTERNLKQLITFIETQKAKLTESQAVLESLKEEESRLRPVVEADRALIDAILEAQSTRNRAHLWKERIISFLLGVIASIMAAVLLTAVNRAYKKRRSGAG